MKIVILDAYTANPGDLSWQKLSDLAELVVYERSEQAEAAARVGDADIVLTNKVAIDREVIEHCPNLKYVGVLATGYNIVDLTAARECGIVVTNVPDYSSDSVAEMVFAYLLKIYHEVALHSDSVKTGDWTNCPDFCYWKTPLFELADKTLGVVGYGQIAKRVIAIAKAFKMNVVVYHHRTAAGTKGEDITFVSLDQLYGMSDVISLHVPLFEATKEMINRESIAKMKDGVLLINTARGGLLDEAAVAEALNSGKIGYLAADVVTQEPIPADHPFLTTPNTLITPHIAWAPREARARLIDVAARNIAAFIAGAPINRVD
ncbi:MAG: glycerate dehydrogenase [Clostridiales bacterium]|nr:MAG: glycerate dehydrogenase [Clostridiales bacterium]